MNRNLFGTLFLNIVIACFQAYHSDVSVNLKESIHRSWMRNETQVVVATIAFGLGYVHLVCVALLLLPFLMNRLLSFSKNQ
jgi:hypothetical protein